MNSTNTVEILISLKDKLSGGIANIRGAFRKLSGTIKKVTGSIFSLQGAFLGLGVGAIIVSFTKAAMAGEKFATVLKTITGSAKAAKESLVWITEFTAKTPYNLAQVTDAFVKLRAYGFDPTAGSLRVLGDTAAGMGKTLMQAVEMFADAAVGEFERIKEFGVRAKQEGEKVTFSWVQNGIEMVKTAKKTQQGITEALTNIFAAKYTGAMSDLSKTMGGMLSNISDHFSRFQSLVMSSGVFDYVKAGVSTVLGKIDQLQKEGTLDEWAKKIASGVIISFKKVSLIFAGLADQALPTLNRLAEGFTEIKNKVANLSMAILLFRRFFYLTDEEKEINSLIGRIKELEEEMANPTWVRALFKGFDAAEESTKKLAVMKERLEELKKTDPLHLLVDSTQVEKATKEMGAATKALHEFFEKAETAGEKGAIEKWMAKSSAEFIKFGDDVSEASKKAQIAYYDGLDSMVEKTTQSYNKIRNEVESYAKKVLEVEKRIELIRASTADKVRNLLRMAMTDEDAYTDERRQAEEKLAAARTAFREDDIETAKRLAKEAETIYSRLAREVTKDIGGENVVVQSLESSVRIATAGITEVGDLAIKIEEVQREAYQKMSDDASEKADEIKVRLDKLAEDRDMVIGLKLEGLSEAQKKISDLTKDETKRITVEVTEKRKYGGIVKKYARGGIFPGYGGGDKVSVLAEAGEGFVRKEAVQKYGEKFFDAYNSMSLPLEIAKSLKARIGGLVGSHPDIPTMKFQGGGVVPAFKDMGRVEIAVGSNAFPVMAEINVIEELKNTLEREKLMRAN